MSDKMMNKELKVRPFYRQKRIVYMISGVLLAAGLAVTLIGGLKLDIQFTGGSITKYAMADVEINTDEAAGVAAGALGGRPVSAQTMDTMVTEEDSVLKNKSLVISLADTGTLSNEDLQVLTGALQEAYPEHGISSEPQSNNVEPFFGRRFLRNGLIALLLSLLSMIIYVWFRFRKIEGLPAGAVAVMCLLHDVSMVFFAFVVFGIPIGDAFIAVALTTLGYSINNTIVVYDRVRENSARNSKMDTEELADLSVSQTMMRCVYTSLAVLVCMAAIYILAAGNGLDSITSFALPMIVSTLFGCYSSVLFAVPTWAMWEKRRAKSKLARAKRK